MSFPKLSIIIPIYNSEKYLDECINSILSQEFQDFELILVDDGSSDRSPLICDKYSKQDTRISVIHTKNGGVSKARNHGIERSTGIYIAFVDADDMVNPRMYSTLYNKAIQTNSDLILCGYKEIASSYSKDIKYNLPLEKMNRDHVIQQLLYSDFIGNNIINSPCNKLYKRDIIIKSHLRFTDRRRGEDWLFNIQYIELCSSAIYIDECLYHYRRNKTSAMSKCFPEQYDLWLENRNVRRVIAQKYSFSVDWKMINNKWIPDVITYVSNLLKKGETQKAKIILSHKELVDACFTSYPLKGIRYESIRKLINYQYMALARIFCKYII